MLKKSIINLLQFVVASISVAIIYLIQTIFFDTRDIAFTISGWTFGFAVAHWLDRDNKLINSMLVSVFLTLTVVVSLSFMSGLYYDILHLFPIITSLAIIYEKRNLKLLYVIISTMIFSIWMGTVYLAGITYQNFTYNMVIVGYFTQFINLFMIYSLGNNLNLFDKLPIKNNPCEKEDKSIAIKAISSPFSKANLITKKYQTKYTWKESITEDQKMELENYHIF